MKLVSIIIPTYNESQTLDGVISDVLNARVVGWKKEVIVVDDGSVDGTSAKLSNWRHKICIIHSSRNIGKGASIAKGLDIAKGEVILIQDADLEYSPSDYKRLLTPFENDRVTVVYGSRFLGSHLSTMYLYALGNKFLTWVTNILYNTNITDMETGFKVFRRDVLHAITIKAHRFDFEPEFTAKILLAGNQIYEVPISYFGRKFSEGKKLTWRDGVVALWTLIRYRFFK